MHHARKLYARVQQELSQFTPMEVFWMAVAFVALVTLAIWWSDMTTQWSHDHLKYMQENPAEVQQWLIDNQGR